MGFGSFLGGLGSSIGRGASFLGNGIKSGVSKLGHLGQLGEAEGGAGGSLPQGLPNLGPGGTGGFAGNEGLPQISPSLINRRQSMPDAMPGLMPNDAPKLDPIRDSVDVSANLPPGQLPMPQHQGQLIPSRPVTGDSTPSAPPLVRQGMAPAFNPPTAMPGRDVARSQVPIPQLPGHRGEPIPYNDIDSAKYDHVMSRMGHTDDGRHETGVKRDWKTSLQNMLMGANQGFQQTGNWAGALGGAGSALGGTLINPQAGREYNFNNSPHLRGEMEGQRKEQQTAEDRSLDVRRKNAEIGGLEARNKATIAGTKDAELERQYRTAQIAKMDAQAEAARLGRPVVKMITDENSGEIYEAQIYPDGRIERRGLSGTAELRREGFESRQGIADKQIKSREGIADKNIQSREKIVGIQQRGATGRTAMSQSGQNARQKERLAAQGGEYVPPVGSKPGGSGKRAQFIQKAVEAGHSREAAEAEATKRGY